MKNNILITGASSGIGLSTFHSIDQSRYENIILVDKNPILVESEKVIVFQCDISSEQDVSALFKKLKDREIKINHLVNSAGVPGPNKPFLSSTVSEFDTIISTNLRGTFLILKYSLEVMEKLNFGKVVNISSVLASCGMSGSSYYSASKAGIVALTKSLAIEFAQKNIQINTVSPGGVDTNLISDLKERIGLNNLAAIHPVKRIAQPEEIAKFISFILDNNTSFMTGSELFIDGGYSAQ